MTDDEPRAITVRISPAAHTGLRVLGGLLDQSQSQLVESWIARSVKEHGLSDIVQKQQKKEGQSGS